MTKETAIKLFEDKTVRTHWDEKDQQWYFSIINVVAVLTNSSNPRDYWFKMKLRDIKEDGLKLSTICRQLKLEASDGKIRATNVANTKNLFRIIQSIPSPKAEAFKLWLAQVAAERLDEMQDPELSIDSSLVQYLNIGYSETWTNHRLKSIKIRKELTDECTKRGLQEGVQFAILSDIITKASSDKTTKEYKLLKGFKSKNISDNITNNELIMNMLAEASTKDISAASNPEIHNI
jgi:hypothetical protein